MPNGEVSPFDKSLEEWEKEARRHFELAQASQKRLEELSKVFEAPKEPVTPLEKIYRKAKPFLLEWGPLVPSTVREQQVKRAAKIEIQSVTNQLEVDDFYYRLYNEVPAVIAGSKSVTADDILSNLTIPETLTSDELSQVTDTISNMISVVTTGRGLLPEMAEEAELPELPELVLPVKAPIPMTLQIATVNEILKALTAPRIPEQVLTDAEWKDLLYQSGQVENEGDVLSLEQQAEELINEWRERDNQLAAFKEGIAEMPDYKITDLLKEAVVQPGLALMEVAGFYFEHVSMPLAGLAYKGLIPDVEAEYQRLRKSGVGVWESAGEAWLAMETVGAGEWITKYMIMEALVDPLTYIGWGIFTRLAKPIPYLGRFVGSIERGAMRVFEAPFDLIKYTVGKMPKTTGQRALASQHHAGQIAEKYLTRFTGKYFNQITMEDWSKASEAALKFFKRHPQSEADAALFAKELLKHKPLSLDNVKSWANQLGTKLTPDDFTRTTVESVNNLFEDLFTLRVLPPKAGAAKLLGILGGESSDDMLKIAQRLVETHGNRIIKEAGAFARARNVNGAMQALMKRNYRYHVALEESVAYLARMEKGTYAALLHDIPVEVQRVWQTYVDKIIIKPFAQAYLTFGMYGPMNVLEDYIRSSLGGVFPRRMNVEAWEKLSWGLRVDPELKRYGLSEMLGPLAREGAEENWNNWVLQLATLGKRGWSEKLYTALVRMPGGFGMDVRRNFIGRKFMQVLAERGGPAVERLAKIGPKPPALASRSLVKQLEAEVYRMKLTGNPELIRGTKDLFTRKQVMRQEVRNTLMKHPEMPDSARQFILKQYDDNILFSDGVRTVDKSMTEAGDMVMDEFLHGPVYAAKQFEDLATVLTDLEVRNPEEMAQLIVSVNKMSEIEGAVPRQIMAQATIKSRGLPFIERRAILDKNYADIYAYMDRAGASIDKVIGRIKTQYAGAGVTQDYIEASNRLLDVLTSRREYIREFRAQNMAARSEIFAGATATDLKTGGFWDDFYRQMDNEYAIFDGRMAELDGMMVQATKMADRAAGIVRTRPPIVVKDRPLAPQDVAQLMGVRGDDISRGLLDVLTAQNSRPHFVQYVLGHVEPSDIGFTKEAIEAVYDQIAISLNVKPETLSWMTSKQMELEATRRELHELWNAKLLPDEEVAAIGKYIDDMADAVEDLIYEKIPVKPLKRFVMEEEMPKGMRAHIKYEVTQMDETLGKAQASAEGWYGLLDKEANTVWAVNPRLGIKVRAFENVMELTDEWWKVVAEHPNRPNWQRQLIEKAPLEVRMTQKKWFEWIYKDDPRLGAKTVGIPPEVPTKAIVKQEFADYDSLRQSSMDEAHKWYYKEYPDYTHANAFDAMMKNIYPYWTYESQRWYWLPRSMIRHPVVATELGRWMNNSDYGYIHVPGTSADINPFRGTIFGTLTTRLTRRDYPEYYDSLPFAGGYVEFMDFLSRYGFYPGAHMGIPLAMMGGREAQFGEVLPATYKTGLDAMIALFPKSETMKAISEGLFNDRFRNYLTIREVGKRGGNGTLIFTKIQEKQELTDEEQAMWDSARSEVAWYSAGFEQFGLFRMRSDEQYQMYDNASKAIEEMTGYTPDQQDWLRKHGHRLWDMVGGMSPTEQQILQELDYYRWVGSVRPLLPGRQQEILNRIELAWDDVRRYTEDIGKEKLQLQREFLSGQRGPQDYNDMLIGLYTKQREYIDQKIEENPLMDMDNRKDYYKEFNIPQPVLHPFREMLNLYFDIELEEITDPETGEKVRDWDTFWAMRDAIELAMPENYKQEWRDYLARNSTRIEELRREVYQNYLKPYNQIWEAVLETFNDEEQGLVKEYLYLEKTGQQLDRQQAIKDIVRENGRKLISNFRSDVSAARVALRFANPSLDAWLFFWGRVTSFQTPQAEQAYKQIAKDTGRKV